jgi:DNA repair protein RadC
MKIIKDMAEHNRPREKLREKGAAALTDEELVAAILGMGTAGVDVRTIGLLDKSPVHPREVFADVITDRAATVIFAHNHPSGELQPSEADLRVHDQLTEAGKILGLRVLDHVIVTAALVCPNLMEKAARISN